MDGRPRILLDGWTAAIPPGPVAFEVQRRLDDQARLCVDDASCPQVVTIKRVVWSGDAVTAAAPRTAPDTFMRLVEADPNLPQATIAAVPRTAPLNSGPQGRPVRTPSGDTTAGPFAGRCTAPYPRQAWTIQGSWITTVVVFPTVAAREAADQNFLGSGFIGTTPDGGTCQMIVDSFFNYEWIAVDNVMVAVQVNVNRPTAAQTKLIDEVRTALTRP
jgi:hypothetical protein